MGKRTGRARGRPPGAKNKATIAKEAFTEEAVRAALDAGISPLDVMLKVMRGDGTITERQFSAAQAAAPYVHPRLAAVDSTVSGKGGGPVRMIIEERIVDPRGDDRD
jgi:hypothetical protein